MFGQILTSNCFLLQFLPTIGRADNSSRTQLEDFHTAGCGEEPIPWRFFRVFLNIPTQPPTPLNHILPFCLIKSWLLGNFSHQPPKALPKSSECEKVHTSFRAKEKGFLCTRYLVDDSHGSLSLHVAYIFINFQMKDNMMLEQWPG